VKQPSNNCTLSDGTWTYGYDAAGQVTSKAIAAKTWAYRYDFNGQITSATDGTTSVAYAYDAFGNRIQRTAGGAVEKFVVDGWDTAKPGAVGSENFDTVLDLDASGNVTTRRLFGAGFDEVLAKQSAAGTATWYDADKFGSVRKLFNSISKEAHDFFAGAYSGPTWEPHRNDTYGGVKHVDYNEMVKEELKEFMRVNGITDKKPMTTKQAREFSENIRKAENLSDPARAANIKKFNDAIVKDLKVKLLPDQGIDATIARGKSYIEKNPKRYKAYIAIGATFYFISMKTAGAAETGAKTVAVLDELSKPGGLYERLLRAAEKGDLAAVETLLIGGSGNEVDPKSKNHVFGFFASAFVDADPRVMYVVPFAHFEFVKWVSAYLTQDKYGGPPVEERSSWWPSTWWPF